MKQISNAPGKKRINVTVELGNITRLHINLTCDEPVETSRRIKSEWVAFLFRIRKDSVSKLTPNICLAEEFLGFPQFDHANVGIAPQSAPPPLPYISSPIHTPLI
jgi:hypothetical protein